MVTALLVTIISYLIFVSYIIAAVLVVFEKVPKSLSDTYYMYKEKQKGLEFLFPALILIMVGTLMPSWIELSNGSNWQFLSFLCPASLLFVGAAPAFKSNELESKVHTVAAILSAVFGLTWVIIFCTYGIWLIILYVLIMGLLSWLSNTYKTCYTFWLEMAAFASVYSGIIITLGNLIL